MVYYVCKRFPTNHHGGTTWNYSLSPQTGVCLQDWPLAVALAFGPSSKKTTRKTRWTRCPTFTRTITTIHNHGGTMDMIAIATFTALYAFHFYFYFKEVIKI